MISNGDWKMGDGEGGMGEGGGVAFTSNVDLILNCTAGVRVE